ncbi:MAG: UDP-N-acetylglucosamine 2-epimerase (non-hydrolyzing) [Pyrinomonadaceae bacterium]|nr:UDP-N-acetylglucosamine 2-epimerase (non-hydrolyzing) [Pyrinomonadaceae bacterium]MCX7638973.1 UDP-N-acetylglucosamine 2-epimerase (non-hydrolyzing) [Pyrinomonadaceae bacterium]MDW8303808.1 UDP-N-acetylglucosamine 2-epimerase (non-hydrolyzing) [Acidobacteriota bacterium]
MLKVLNVVGARPNFMKIAPIMKIMKKQESDFLPLLVHTGQHYDFSMSEAFFKELEIPEPDFYLGVGSASHAVQTAKIMIAFEEVVTKEKPNWVVVVGDVNSTIACALVCAKLGIKVAHVEAGLRSRDRTMPEEINRILTDAISDLLFTTCEEANENLKAEGISAEKIEFVGNVMIDSLFFGLEKAKKSKIRENLGIEGIDYAVLTLHRPSNVDNEENFKQLLEALIEISRKIPIIFPAHPRTKTNMEKFGLEKALNSSQIRLIEPLSYFDFLNLFSGAKFVMTDSGGLQEETTALAIPCLTLRENTERMITVEMGTNELVGTNPERIVAKAFEILDGKFEKVGKTPPLWDGKTAERICNALLRRGYG